MIFPDTLESRTYTWFEFHREFDMIVQLSNTFLRERDDVAFATNNFYWIEQTIGR